MKYPNSALLDLDVEDLKTKSLEHLKDLLKVLKENRELLKSDEWSKPFIIEDLTKIIQSIEVDL